jgi:protein-disulfide isomerase
MQKSIVVLVLLLSLSFFSGCKSDDPSFVRDPSKPVLLEEFSDIECPYCKVIHPTIDLLRENLSDTVQFRYAYFPLESIHQYAFQAAEAVECVRMKEGEELSLKYLSEAYKASNLSKESLISMAKTVNADPEKLRTCLDKKESEKVIKANIEEGIKRGVTGTPTIFINGEKTEARTYEELYIELKKLQENQQSSFSSPQQQEPSPSASQ